MLASRLVHSVGGRWFGAATRSSPTPAARLIQLGARFHTGTRVSDLAELPPGGDHPRPDASSGPRRGRRSLPVAVPAGWRFRYGPASSKIDWARTARCPGASAGAEAGTVHLGGHLDEITAGERDVARGRHSQRPFVACRAADRGRSEPRAGRQHVLWAYCHVPNGSDVDLTAVIEAQLERLRAGFADRVLARHVHGPKALEAFARTWSAATSAGGAADLPPVRRPPGAVGRPWRRRCPACSCARPAPRRCGVHGMGAGKPPAGNAR